MAQRIIPVPAFDLIIFGATGDLACRKIFPALYHRMQVGQMPADARIIGAARSSFDNEGFRIKIREAIEIFVANEYQTNESIERFLNIIDYVRIGAKGDEDDNNGWGELTALIGRFPNRIKAFYLSVAPSLFEIFASRLAKSGFADAPNRIIVEKPFGRDQASARKLNQALSTYFRESQIYRIDHYLGKETVQNLMALRFANALFEPLWNARHIDHVQITVAETIGVGGRGSYYDQSGAIRDMVQNHLMQLLCLTAMEPPGRFEPDAVRDEKLKVIKALEPLSSEELEKDVIRGQYRAGVDTPCYRDEAGNAQSRTECFVALRARIANWRWSGTPFYLRTGKRLRAQMSEIAVVFKDTPHSIFSPESGQYRGNILIIRLQPDEGITLQMTIKEPGLGGMRLMEVPLDMTFAEKLSASSNTEKMPDAYERLIMDVIRGDQTLFMRGDEVETAWGWIDPIIQSWDNDNQKPKSYDSGSSGPEDALMLMHRDGRKWREISS